MPLPTLWESICALAGTDGTAEVGLDDAVGQSAVPMKVAEVEVRRMVDDGILVYAASEERIQLTDRGRRTCFDASGPTQSGLIIGPDE